METVKPADGMGSFGSVEVGVVESGPSESRKVDSAPVVDRPVSLNPSDIEKEVDKLASDVG